jgi:cyanate permease
LRGSDLACLRSLAQSLAFGPRLLGALRDATGGYAVPVRICILLELTAAAIVVLRIGPARAAAMAHKKHR